MEIALIPHAPPGAGERCPGQFCPRAGLSDTHGERPDATRQILWESVQSAPGTDADFLSTVDTQAPAYCSLFRLMSIVEE